MLKITKGLISTDVTGITQYIDDKGNEYVRVKMDGEDFCIAARDYARGRKHTFTWNDAMESLNAEGLTMLTNKQIAIYDDHITAINKELKKIGGKKLKHKYYWTESAVVHDTGYAYVYYGAYDASEHFFNFHNLDLNYNFQECIRVRPVLNLSNK